MKQIIVGAVFAAAIAAGVAISAGPAAADNGVIHMEAKASGGSATTDATAIEYGLAARSGGGTVTTEATATRSSH